MGLKEWAEKNKAGRPGQLAKKAERVQARADLKADWYDDPHHVTRLRYWDGAQWTEHTAP